MKSFAFWAFALLLTLASAYYQRKTGPTYPISGEGSVAGQSISYTMQRSHGGAGDQTVSVHAADPTLRGVLFFKRYKTDDAWTSVEMLRNGDSLMAALPHQPPAGKLEYAVEVLSDHAVLRIPEKESIVTRFKGDVPAGVLIPHVIAMFLAMFVSMRAGLEVFRKKPSLRTLTLVTIILLLIGGLILGPIVQKYAFGAYWTGFPFGTDLTDNKTLIAFLAWLAALAAVWRPDAMTRSPWRRWVVFCAAVITLAVYLIPHSMMGSELNYRELDKLRVSSDSTQTVEQADTSLRKQ